MQTDVHETQARWFAVHTRSKCEKFVQRALAKKGINAYVPLQKLLRRYQRKSKWVEKPLITCYVFVEILKKDYIPVLETENVSGFVKSGKDLRAIPDTEIELLRRVTLEKDLEIEAVQGVFREGDEVFIAGGHLYGMKGRIVQQAGKRKFSVELETLGYSLLITVDGVFLERTND